MSRGRQLSGDAAVTVYSCEPATVEVKVTRRSLRDA